MKFETLMTDSHTSTHISAGTHSVSTPIPTAMAAPQWLRQNAQVNTCMGYVRAPRSPR